jgi:outer membrane immunogenic protein
MYSGTKPFGYAGAWATVRTTTLGIALVALHVAGASAEGIADRSTIRDGSCCAQPNWTGFYIGGHAGHAWANADWTFQNNSQFNSDPGDKFRHNLHGGFGGIQIGFNRQVGRWVWGLEGTLSGVDVEKASFSPFLKSDTLSTDISTLWTITGRLGYTWDRWLAYGKAGYAGGRIEISAVDVIQVGEFQSANQAKTHHGWTVGLGVEYLLTQNVVFGIEYAYIDLGKARYQTVDSAGTLFDVDNDVTAHSVMARLSYKFGH